MYRSGFLFGAAIGIGLAAILSMRKKIRDLETRLSDISTRLAGKTEATKPIEPSPAPPAPVSISVAHPRAGSEDDSRAMQTATVDKAPPATPDSDLGLRLDLSEVELDETETTAPAETTETGPGKIPSPPSLTDEVFERISGFFTGGNLLVRVGIVILLFGFGFLVKYAAARNYLPIEVRLAFAFLGGVGLLAIGWRLKEHRKGYAVTLQGGGVGIMYLTLFAAARLYHIIPIPLSFLLMVALVFLSAAMAMMQNALGLAFFGAVGGFMAPVLSSTGTGSHVVLFSYYALLNAGIVGIAWFKSWRILNLVGFFFTFGIGSTWGIQYYRPAYFSTTEPFVILFFIFYLTISILFAMRQPPRLKGYVDGTLVFGLPVITMTIQWALVRDTAYGLAFSALAIGLVYVILASILWKKRPESFRALVEAFLAFGVVFGSVAIPLAVDAQWTSAAWGLEGAALVWIGVKQRRWMARGFGILLQIGAAVSYGQAMQYVPDPVPVLNRYFIGAFIIAGAGLLSGYFLYAGRDRLHRYEKNVDRVALTWGLLWWFAAGLMEIERQLPYRHETHALLTFIALSCAAMGIVCNRLKWRDIGFPPMGLLPVATLVSLFSLMGFFLGHPFSGWGAAAWVTVFFAIYRGLHRFENIWPGRVVRVWHIWTFCLAIFLLSWELSWVVHRLVAGAEVWEFTGWALMPAVTLLLLNTLKRRLEWPFKRFSVEFDIWVPGILSAGLIMWGVAGLGQSGDPAPLGFLPLLNPLDIVQVFVFIAILQWVLSKKDMVLEKFKSAETTAVMIIPAPAIFLWLNAVVARTVHHFWGIRYDMDALNHSIIFHTSISVLWGTIALGIMVWAHRRLKRAVWFAGAVLLALEVVKLFVVDLSGSGSISRIISFLAVGGLILIIGFFSPLPPTAEKEQSP
ncbi:MAG: DUF2339 domain-containing protein [Desulfobacteraceae bacterium]|nr:DUF2339 domain-containing protein [Desulfobacteraceae bacterium]